jgi:hypothetical protein
MLSTETSETARQGRCDVLRMSYAAPSGALRYAVIEAIRSQGGRERFAIAYLNERSLHTMLAAACIIATGFFSREEALQACAAPVALAS